MKSINIGLFGFGVVGEGIYQVLQEKPELNISVKRICIRHPYKRRNAPRNLFTTLPDKILDDPEIDIVVELIDDAQAAFAICHKAMSGGKHVVSANKKMIAENLQELIELQHKHGVSFLYEGAVCGSIPIIRNLEEYFDNDLLHSVSGVVNGSTNYILTKMSTNGHTYQDILAEAQELGLAESDPTLDVEGIDASYKLSLILFHAFGTLVDPQAIVRKGINALHPFDMQYAREKGRRIKLIARTDRVNGSEYTATILPGFVDADNKLYDVNNEFNGVLIRSSLADEQFLSGKGAGRYPTASAVLSDISALRYGYKYEYRKHNPEKQLHYHTDSELKLYVSYAPDAKPEISDFIEVHEIYQGKERSYLIGTISVEKLRRSKWLSDSKVSVITECENVRRRDGETETRSPLARDV